MKIPFFYFGQKTQRHWIKNVSPRDSRLDLIRRKLVTWRIKRHLHYISFLNKPIFKLFKSSTKHLIEFVTDCLYGKHVYRMHGELINYTF